MERIAGFTIVFVVLITIADIPAMAPLAVAFAWVIFLSALMLVGPIAAERLSSLLGATTLKDTQSPGAAGGLI